MSVSTTLPTVNADPAKTLVGRRIILGFETDRRLTGVAATSADDIFTLADHPLHDGDEIIYLSGTGFTGLTADTHYFVVNSVAGVSFQLATAAGGEPVDLSADGSAGVFGFAQVNLRGKIANWTRNQQEPLKNVDIDEDDNLVVNLSIAQGGTNDVVQLTLNEPRQQSVVAHLINYPQLRITSGRLWVKDPRDAVDVVALLSRPFSGLIYFGGSVNLGEELATVPAMLHVDGFLRFDPNAAAS